MQKISILGDGITAKAVRDALPHTSLSEVSLEDAEVIVASPGIPPHEYPQTGIPVISEIELAYRLLQKQNKPPFLIGVTGTNGKTTVTEMIAHICQIPTAGNIGIPLISFINHPTPPQTIVVELSSYQLENCPTFRPNIAVLLNISEDHLIWHQSMTEYIHAKAKIGMNQENNDVFIFNKDDANVRKISDYVASVRQPFTSSNIPDEIKKNTAIIGEHNQLNACAAYFVAKELGIHDKEIFESLETYHYAEHRLEKVIEHKGVTFYNDSKATNPDAVMKAMASFNGRNIHLILCGEDKHLPLENFIAYILKHAATIHIFGGITQTVMNSPSAQKKIIAVDTLKSAIYGSKKHAKPGDIVLFSPSSSSHDLYNNYEERGHDFKRLVMTL